MAGHPRGAGEELAGIRKRASPSPRLRGEGGVRGRFRQAQNRGDAPSPSLRSHSRCFASAFFT